MFCPNCHAEYVEGIRQCRDCGVPLVDKLPPDQGMYEFTEILSTFNLVDIAVIKSILDDGEIHYYFIGENFNQIDQLVQPTRLFIREDDVEEAKELLKDFSLTYLGLAPNKDDKTDL